jgi:hypothetical protein
MLDNDLLLKAPYIVPSALRLLAERFHLVVVQMAPLGGPIDGSVGAQRINGALDVRYLREKFQSRRANRPRGGMSFSVSKPCAPCGYLKSPNNTVNAQIRRSASSACSLKGSWQLDA